MIKGITNTTEMKNYKMTSNTVDGQSIRLEANTLLQSPEVYNWSCYEKIRKIKAVRWYACTHLHIHFNLKNCVVCTASLAFSLGTWLSCVIELKTVSSEALGCDVCSVLMTGSVQVEFELFQITVKRVKVSTP